jgi:hypothetical protein
MAMDVTAVAAVVGCEALALFGSLFFFRHSRVDVPPIGVFGLDDAIAVGILVVIAPFVYLALPYWLVASLFLLGGASLLQLAFAAVLPPTLVWPLVVTLTVADGAALSWLGSRDIVFLGINDCLVIVVVIGLANLWAQSGLRVRAAVVLGAGVAVYDYLATLEATLMHDVVDRLSGVAFAPRVAFAAQGGAILNVGLGDLLLASVFPLLLRRAYGRPAAIVSVITGFAALAAMTAAADLGLAPALPAMVVLWPLMLIQYAWWRRRGPERTTYAYLVAEPRRLDAPPARGIAAADWAVQSEFRSRVFTD